MKNLNTKIIIAIILSMGILASCNKNDDETPAPLGELKNALRFQGKDYPITQNFYSPYQKDIDQKYHEYRLFFLTDGLEYDTNNSEWSGYGAELSLSILSPNMNELSAGVYRKLPQAKDWRMIEEKPGNYSDLAWVTHYDVNNNTGVFFEDIMDDVNSFVITKEGQEYEIKFTLKMVAGDLLEGHYKGELYERK